MEESSSHTIPSTADADNVQNNCDDDDMEIMEVAELYDPESTPEIKAKAFGRSSWSNITCLSNIDSEELDYDQDIDSDDDDDNRIEAGEEAADETTHSDENEGIDDGSPFDRYRKIVIGLLFVAVILFVICDSTVGKGRIREGMTVFLEWIRENPGVGVVCFVLVFFLASLICVPGALLTIGAGYVFAASFDGCIKTGIVIGTLAVFVGAVTSSTAAFLLSRYLLYERVRRLSQKYSIFEALDVALSEKGFRIMCLLRLSPITPYVLLNYIAGVTTVKFSSYSLSIFCVLPGTILYVFLGATAGSLTDKNDNSTVTMLVVVVGAVLGIFAIGMTSYYARKELNKEVDLVRSRLYTRTTSLQRRKIRYRRSMERRKRSRYRRSIDKIRAK